MKVKKAIRKLKLGLRVAKSVKYKDPKEEEKRKKMIIVGEELLKKLNKLDPNMEIENEDRGN